jgi:autotransporter translocation and assembly factor TamB
MTGVLTWDGAGWSPATLDGDLTFSLGPGRIGEIPFDAVATKGRVAEKRLLLERIDASFLGGEIEGAGEVGFDGHVDLAATSKFEDLSRVARMLHLEGAGGRGTFTGQIVRDDSLLSIDGVLDGETWQVNGLRLNQVDATGTLESRDGAVTVIASGEVGGIEGYGKTLGGVRAAVRYEGDHLLLEELAGQIAGVDFTAQGEWIREAEVDRFVISSLAITRNGEVKTYRDAIEVQKRGSVFTLVPTSFPFRGGLLSMRGEYDVAGPIEVEASWEGLHLSDLRLPAAVPRRLFESVSGNLSISGTRQRPNVRIDLSGSSAAADSAPKDGFAAIRLDVEYAAGRPLGVALRLADAGGRARLAIDGTLADSLPSSLPRPAGGVRETIRLLARPDLTVQADSLPIEWLRGVSRSLNDFGGPLFATWRFTGPIDSLAASGAFTVSPLRYKSRDVAPLAGDISLGDAGLVLDITFPPEWGASRIHAVLPARLDATKPMFAFDGSKPFSLDARVEKGDLSLFTLFMKEAREAHGEFALVFAGSGRLEKPTLSGMLTITKGTLIIRDLVEYYEDVTGEIKIENNLFTVTSLRAKEGEKGTVEASGTFRLVRWKADELDFKLRLRNFNVESIPETGATINADIDVQTRETDFGWRCPHLTGTIDIVGAVVEQNFRSSGEKPPTPAIFRATATPDWTARIRIRAPEDIWIANDDMEVELRADGDFILGRSNRGLGLIGRLEVVGGRYRLYYSWIANELDVEEGEIVWRNPDDAQQFWLSARATTDASGERVEITVQGPPDSLIINASSDGNLSESEILGSLAIGQSTGEEETGNTSRSLVGAWGTVFAQLLTRELTRGLRGFVGFDIVTPEGVPQFVVSKDIARHVDVAVQQDITTLPGSQPTETTDAERAYLPERQFRIRYRMTRAFYLEALTGSLQDGSQVYNLDLKWRLSY